MTEISCASRRRYFSTSSGPKSGRFSLGDSVLVLSEDDRELAVGMVNYHSGDIKKIMGLRSTQIESILGFKHDDEVIHRDNLVTTNDMGAGDDLCQLGR